jgi:glycopeptide antibiotics resistance protein
LIYVIYTTLLPNLFTKLFSDFGGNLILLIPFALGLMMLTRIVPKASGSVVIPWLS